MAEIIVAVFVDKFIFIYVFFTANPKNMCSKESARFVVVYNVQGNTFFALTSEKYTKWSPCAACPLISLAGPRVFNANLKITTKPLKEGRLNNNEDDKKNESTDIFPSGVHH